MERVYCLYVERNSVLRYDRVLFIIAVDIADTYRWHRCTYERGE